MLAYYASRDLVPLYAVYALLFRDHGLSVAQTSSLFVLWSVTSFVLEVPSGAWADLVDRRRLLVASALVYALGFGAWTVGSGYAAYALGFVLWGLSGAMMSGTFESAVYDEMVARGTDDDYPRLIGWAESAAMVANLLATLSAAPLFAWGGYALVGWASVAVALVQALLAATLPVRGRDGHGGAGEVAAATQRVLVRYAAMFRAGVREAATEPVVRRAVLLAAFLAGTTAYDEYFPLVAGAHGVPTATVPLLVGLVVLGQAVGTALAGRTAGWGPARTGWLVAAAGTLISVGVLVEPRLGFVAVAVGYGLLSNAMVVAEARVQRVITGPARATVTSVLGVGEEAFALAVFVSFGGASRVLGVPVLVALLGVPVVLVGLVVRRWGRPPSSREPDP